MRPIVNYAKYKILHLVTRMLFTNLLGSKLVTYALSCAPLLETSRIRFVSTFFTSNATLQLERR